MKKYSFNKFGHKYYLLGIDEYGVKYYLKDFFKETPFTNDEIWEICELMKSFYIAREYSDMIYRGGAHYTSNPAKEIIKNETEYTRINKVVIPNIMTELYKILEDKGE